MKKFDLHIHTVSTNSDSDFEFNLEKLKEYIGTCNIDCIAITNHNLFDYEQFNIISESLDICVLPGIEIDLENGHLLLISDNNELDDFYKKCSEVNQLISSPNDSITIEELKKIFVDLSRYLLIPHYEKNHVLMIEYYLT